MFITRKKYEEDLAKAHQEGMDEAWSMVRAVIKNITAEDNETPKEEYKMECTIPAVPDGEACPADRLDI